jgi:Beta-L-arabinofuranosidase, GH127
MKCSSLLQKSSPLSQGKSTVRVFWESDVGKWIEAASYALSHRRDADIEAKIDAVVDDLLNAQIRDEIAAATKKSLWKGRRGPAWLPGREPRASQAQKPRAPIALGTSRTWARSTRDDCIVFR